MKWTQSNHVLYLVIPTVEMIQEVTIWAIWKTPNVNQGIYKIWETFLKARKLRSFNKKEFQEKITRKENCNLLKRALKLYQENQRRKSLWSISSNRRWDHQEQKN